MIVEKAYEINNLSNVRLPRAVVKKLYSQMRITYIHERGHALIHAFFTKEPSAIDFYFGRNKKGEFRVSGSFKQVIESHCGILFSLKILNWWWDVLWLFINHNKSWNPIKNKTFIKNLKKQNIVQ